MAVVSLTGAVKSSAVVLAVCTVLGSTATARADDTPDTVMMTNGGRIRGTVMEEDPQKGVTVKLGDGTVRKLAPKEVKEVRYGGSAAPAPVAPVPAPPPVQPLPAMGTQPNMVLTPNGYVPNGYAPGGYVPGYMPNGYMMSPMRPMKRKNGGLYAAGVVLLIFGASGVAAGGVLLAAGVGDDGCGHDGGTFCLAGAAMIPISLTFLIASIPMTVVGGHRVPADGTEGKTRWWLPSEVSPTPYGGLATWQF